MKDVKATRFWYKSYSVEAVRVTEQNIADIARECGGDYNELDRYMNVGNVNIYVGDWVLEVGKGLYQFWSDEEFQEKFQTNVQRLSEDEKFAKITELVHGVALAQDSSTYHGDGVGEMDVVIETAVRKILREL
jgi:hypothetical protein